MKIISNTASRKKSPFPKGKLTIRWVASRACHQIYAGGRYVMCASGVTSEDAFNELEWFYETPPGYRDSVKTK